MPWAKGKRPVESDLTALDRATMKADWNEIVRLACVGAALEVIPEGTGIVKNSFGFSDLRRKGKPENDEWHTCGKVFGIAGEALQALD